VGGVGGLGVGYLEEERMSFILFLGRRKGGVSRCGPPYGALRLFSALLWAGRIGWRAFEAACMYI
jgi:hypothetical protein